jgi:threonine/homoserine/homoserine lactone efflux protein
LSEALALGILFGIGAALSVGPIFVTIIHESITRGFGSGLRVILGSATADVVLIVPALAATWLIAGAESLSTLIAVGGAAYFLYLAFQAARDSRRLWRGGTRASTPPASQAWTYAKGVLGNLLNPLSWVFWLATGTPTMLRVDRAAGWPGLVVFTVTWFGVAMLVEAAIAAAVAQSRKALSTRTLALVQAGSAATFTIVAVTLVLGRTR